MRIILLHFRLYFALDWIRFKAITCYDRKTIYRISKLIQVNLSVTFPDQSCEFALIVKFLMQCESDKATLTDDNFRCIC
jgi:hypothetical protein